MSRALVGYFRSANSWVVCPISECDPEYHILYHIMLKTSKFVRLGSDLAHQFWELATSFTDLTGQIFGPAHVFAFACSKLGWLLCPNFVIMVSPGVRISLLYTDKIELRVHLVRAWGVIVRENISHKVQLRDLPRIDMQQSRQVYLKLDVGDRKLMLYHMCGVIQTNLVRAKYKRGVSEQCRYCDSRDTVRHRHFDCTVTERLREEWAADLGVFSLLPKARFHLSFCIEHDEMDFALAGNYMRDLEVLLPPTDEPILAYTDGSVQIDHGRVLFRAGFAVVAMPQPVSTSIDEIAMLYRSQGVLPSFEVARVGLVRGRQTNNRGELSAIICALMLSTDIEIVTDSLYAIDVVQRVLSDPVLEHHREVGNRDLVAVPVQLVTTVSYRRVRLRKVKSHLAILDSRSAGEVLDILGNSFADEVAKMCATRFDTPWDRTQREVDRFAMRQWKVMCKLQTFQVAAAREFNKAWKIFTNSGDCRCCSRQSVFA